MNRVGSALAAVGLVAASVTTTALATSGGGSNGVITAGPGEGLSTIARRCGLSLQLFMQQNGLTGDPATIKFGPGRAFFCVPSAFAPTPTSTTIPAASTTLPPVPTVPSTTMPATTSTTMPPMDHGNMGGPGLPSINLSKIPAPQVGESRGEAWVNCPVSVDSRYPCGIFGVPEPAGPTNNGVGAFRTDCGFSHMAFDDPIVFPGQSNASHLHTFFGNVRAYAKDPTTGAPLDLMTMANSGNSTCGGGILNRTAYWVPTVILPDGSPLAPINNQVYYKTGYNGVDGRNIVPFPTGLRMIAGSAGSTSPQRGIIGYDCRDIGGTNSDSIPSCPAGSIMQMHVQFPQCWNGRDLDSADHKSHMAYPLPPGAGAYVGCPSTHPVALPEIGFNIWYRVPPGQNSGAWRLASDKYDGGPGGFSGHGDWLNGWDPAIMQTWVKRCLNDKFDCGTNLLGDGRLLGIRP